MGGQHLFSSAVGLQGFCGVDILRQLRFASHHGPLFPLAMLQLSDGEERQRKLAITFISSTSQQIFVREAKQLEHNPHTLNSAKGKPKCLYPLNVYAVALSQLHLHFMQIRSVQRNATGSRYSSSIKQDSVPALPDSHHKYYSVQFSC